MMKFIHHNDKNDEIYFQISKKLIKINITINDNK